MSATASRPKTIKRVRGRRLYEEPLPSRPVQVEADPPSSSSSVESLLDEAVSRIQSSSRSAVLLRREAEQIVTELEEKAPGELMAYFRNHAVSLMREQLQLRLAAVRGRERRGVFGQEPGRGDEQIDNIPRVDPFSVRYAVEGNVWRPLGDMTKGDWTYIADNRSDTAINSMFEIAFAKHMAERLPDDTTPTRAVVSEEELDNITRQARARAERAVSRFRQR